MDYYTAKEVQKITGASQNNAYEIIRKLREMFKEEYPKAIQIQGRIHKWYFEKIMMNKEGKENEENKMD